MNETTRVFGNAVEAWVLLLYLTLAFPSISYGDAPLSEIMQNFLVPMVVEQTGRGERGYDIYSRLLVDRIVFPRHTRGRHGRQFDPLPNCCSSKWRNRKKDIHLYINSPGGSVTAGLAILRHDAVPDLRREHRIASVRRRAWARYFCAVESKGKRYALPNANIMIHQILGGAGRPGDRRGKFASNATCFASSTASQQHYFQAHRQAH